LNKELKSATNLKLCLLDKAILSHNFHNKKEEVYQKKTSEILKLENVEIDYFLSNLSKKTAFLPKKQQKFTFIALFAGIGGFRIALQNLGGKCVFTSEWDKQAQETYFDNFGDYPFGDITLTETKNFIPKGFDVLCAGFPCQAFS
jgi:DNA (cytosine-5)-methyltransferase 1